jgi:hypothetical protein
MIFITNEQIFNDKALFYFMNQWTVIKKNFLFYLPLKNYFEYFLHKIYLNALALQCQSNIISDLLKIFLISTILYFIQLIFHELYSNYRHLIHAHVLLLISYSCDVRRWTTDTSVAQIFHNKTARQRHIS